MGCSYGGIDLTEGLFAFFIGYWPTEGGVLIDDWEFTDEAPPAQPAAPPSVKTTKPPPPPAIVTSTVPKSVISSAKISSTSVTTAINTNTTSIVTSSAVVATASSTSVDYLSGVVSGLAIPTGSIDSIGASSNIEVLNAIMIQLGGLAMAAGKF